MTTTSVTELLPPTIGTARSDGAIIATMSANWRNLNNGTESFVNMDCVWDVRYGTGVFGQAYSHHGESDIESDTVRLVRAEYFPMTSKTLTGMKYRVRGVYSGTSRYTGFWGSPVVTVSTPPAPTIEISPEEKGTKYEVQVTAKQAEGRDPRRTYESYDLVIEAKWTTGKGTTKTEVRTSEPLATSLTESFDISTSESGLMGNEYVALAVRAYARGIAGNGDVATESYVFAQPPVPVITGISTEGDVATGTVCVRISTNESAYHPVDSVTLERTNSAAKDASELAITPGVSWTSVSMVDGGDCTGLTDRLADAYPYEKGTRTYYRVRVERGQYVRYSAPVDLGIYVPEPEYKPGCAYIFNAESGADGRSAAIDVAWQDDSIVGPNITSAELAAYEGATRLSWSDFEFAWMATSGLSEYDFGWEDDPAREVPDAPSEGYSHTARIWVNGLEEGTPCYVCARRVLKGPDEHLGVLSNKVSVTPLTAPEWVRLSAPAYIARGASLAVSWTFGSEREQTGWNVVDDASGAILASGTDASGYATVPPEMLSGLDEVTVRVVMTTGGEWVSSEPSTVRVVDPPGIALIGLSKVTSMPFALMVDTLSTCDVAITVTSRGIVYETPTGTVEQFAGDVVWSSAGKGVVFVDGDEVSGLGYSAEDFSFDPGVAYVGGDRLVNGCTYDVRAIATDRMTGLASEVATMEFECEWGHLAGIPGASAEPGADLSCAISLEAPDGAEDTDVCDVYRMTPDGCDLIASGVPFGSTVTDRFAPYASKSSGVSTAYRVAARTAEGDVLWRDVPYELAGSSLRLDWADSSVELPYNISVDEAFEKRFEAREYLDGTTRGYWDKGASATASLSTDVIRVMEPAKRALIRQLATYAGAVLVRIPNGCAFDADVEVHMSEAYDNGAVPVSLDCTRVELTDAHRCSSRDIAGGPDE